LVTAPLDGATNMALDEALMARAALAEEAVLRVYGWSRPTLSLGRNQMARGRYDLAAARAQGVEVVRRPTGGRAVLHHREVTYSVTAPVALLGSPRESYTTINRLLIHGLLQLGVDAREAAPTGASPKPGIAPCFMVPVKGEIVAGGRKLVGSAQVRENGTLLQHGSILVDDDQALASTLLVVPAQAPPSPATLHSLLGRAPSLDEVASALSAAIPGAESLEIDAALAHAARAASERYRDPEWTWRR
jgi:lipoate-protein ligase A